MKQIETFSDEVKNNIVGLGKDSDLKSLTIEWMKGISPHRYTYNFTSLGRPIIQFPQDMIAMQELIWDVKPDLILETGIAHGGSLILSASMLAMLDVCDAISGARRSIQKSRVAKCSGLISTYGLIIVRQSNRTRWHLEFK